MSKLKALPRASVFAAATWMQAVGTLAFCSAALAAGSTPPSGSGFFITPDGYFVTTHHVVASVPKARLTLPNGDTREAEVVAVDRVHDLALLKAEGKFTALAVSHSRPVRRGWSVMTVGYPQVAFQGIEPKVTRGIVNSLSGIRDNVAVFQVDLSIQPGNSGGPLVTNHGTVIGVVTHQLNSRLLFTNLGVMTQNVNYAVKSEHLLALAARVSGVRERMPEPPRRPPDFPALTALVEAATAIVSVSAERGPAGIGVPDILVSPATNRN